MMIIMKLQEKGNLKLEFDNVYGDADFAFNTEYTQIVMVKKLKQPMLFISATLF